MKPRCSGRSWVPRPFPCAPGYHDGPAALISPHPPRNSWTSMFLPRSDPALAFSEKQKVSPISMDVRDFPKNAVFWAIQTVLGHIHLGSYCDCFVKPKT